MKKDDPYETIMKLVDRRAKQTDQVVAATEHMARSVLVHILLSYIPIDEVGLRVIPMVCKEQER